MAPRGWKQGTVIRRTERDGATYYGHLLEFPYAAFYDLRTGEPIDDLDRVVSSTPLFTVAAHKSLTREWEPIGERPVDLSPPTLFRQDMFDPSRCTIVEPDGSERPATPEECEGLEREAVWEPDHIGDRLMDHYAGRTNPWLADLELKRP